MEPTTTAANPADANAQAALAQLDQRTKGIVSSELATFKTGLMTEFGAEMRKVYAEAKATPSGDTSNGAGDAEPRRRRLQLASLTADSQEVKDFSIGRLIKGMLSRNPMKHCPHEFEMCIAAAEDADPQTIEHYVARTGASGAVTKDMATSPDPSGGYLVPMQVMEAQIIPLLQAQTTILDKVGGRGCQKFPNLTGAPVRFNRVSGPTTAFHINHDTKTSPTAITTSDMSLDQMELYPHTTAAAVVLSNDLINRSGGAAEALVRKQIARDIGLLLDLDGYQGNGTAGAPAGLVGSAGLNVVSTFGSLSASGAYNKLKQMIFEVQNDNALFGDLGWAMHPAALLAIEQQLDPTDNSQPKARRIITEGKPLEIMGYPYVVTTQFPVNQIAFGDWSQLYYGAWGSMFLAVDSLTVLRRLQTQVLAAVQYDFGVAQPTAFCITSGLTGAP